MKRPPYAKHLQLYAWAARHCHGKHVTDLGCGTGHGLQIISHFAKSVEGIDISPHDTNIAKNLQMGCDSAIVLSNLEGMQKYEFTGEKEDFTFLAFEFLEHIKDPHALLSKIQHLPLICSVPHAYPHPLHLTEYNSLTDFLNLLCPYYPTIELFYWRDGNIDKVVDMNPKVPPERYVAICHP